MFREWIKLDNIEIYDEFHFKTETGFEVNVEKDGNTTEYHKEGIQRIKEAHGRGCKTLPILVMQDGDTYRLLDGFKRAYAHKELGEKHIEAFVCSVLEVEQGKTYPFQDHFIRCGKGGLPFEHFGLFEGAETDDQEYGRTKFLFKSEKPDGLRIEVAENIHVHHSLGGKYRLALGRRDFEALARCIMAIEI